MSILRSTATTLKAICGNSQGKDRDVLEQVLRPSDSTLVRYSTIRCAFYDVFDKIEESVKQQWRSFRHDSRIMATKKWLVSEGIDAKFVGEEENT